MNKKDNDWTIENPEYDLETCLRYRSIPISKKLEYLDETNEFFNKLTPLKNKRAWEKLREEGW